MSTTHRILALTVVSACLMTACGSSTDEATTSIISDTVSSSAPPSTPATAATSTVAPPSVATTAATPAPTTTVAPTTTMSPPVDAAIRPASFPGPIEPGTHRFRTIAPRVDITFGDGWSTGWELGDRTLAPNYTAAFTHALTDGYVRVGLWSMTGDDTRIDGEFPQDLRRFLREHPEIVDRSEHDTTLANGWSATQFDFDVAGAPQVWIPQQVVGEPIGDHGVEVGDGHPQHWTVIDTTTSFGGMVQPSFPLLVTWEVVGIDPADAAAMAAMTDEASNLAAPLVDSIVASDVPPPGAALRVDWMTGGRDVTPTAEIHLGGTEAYRAAATDDRVIAADDHSVFVVDPLDDTVEVAPVDYNGAGFGLSYDTADGLWTPNFTGSSVKRLDPATFDEVAEVEVGLNPSMVTMTGGFVWTSDHRGGTVSKIDPATNERIGQFQVSGPGRGGPAGPVAQGNDLWVPVPFFDQLTRINATTGEIIANLELAGPDTDPVIIGDRLFAYSSSNDLVHVVDTTTNELITSVQLGAYPSDVIDIDGTPWVLAAIDRTSEAWMVAIDPDTLQIVDQVRVRFPATNALDAFGSIWITGADGTLTRYPREAFGR